MSLESMAQVVSAVITVSSVINVCTKHYSGVTGAAWYVRLWKTVLWLIERASVLSSADSGQSIKPPLTSVPPGKSGGPPSGPPSGPPCIALLCVLASCSGWHETALTTLDGLYAATHASQQGISAAYNARCTSAAKACHERSDLECVPLRKCQEDRGDALHAVSMAYVSIADARSAIVSAPDSGPARDVALQSVQIAARLVEKLTTDWSAK